MEPSTKIKCDSAEYFPCSISIVEGTTYTSKLVCQLKEKTIDIPVNLIGVYGINKNGPVQSTLYLAMNDYQYEKLWITGSIEQSIMLIS